MLNRKIFTKLEEWYKSGSNKTILLTGARQVGKTFIIREFLKRNAKSFVEFNLFENDSIEISLFTYLYDYVFN